MTHIVIRREAPRRGVRSPFDRAIGSAEARALNRSHPKMVFEGGGIRIVLPYAPRTSSHTGFVPQYTEVNRPGLKPLLIRTSASLVKFSCDLFLGEVNRNRPIEATWSQLRGLAYSQDPFAVLNGPQGNRLWRITAMSMEGVDMTKLNTISRATVSLELTQTSDLAPVPGPVAAVVQPQPPPPPRPPSPPNPAAPPAPRFHTVVKGESLSLISKNHYGTINRWKDIATANNIRNPDFIQPGQKLRIP